LNSKFLFDYTYSCRVDNGPTTTRDGSRFRGRAFMYLTGRDKYTDLQGNWNAHFPQNKKNFLCDTDECEANYELLINDLDFSMKSSLAFWGNVKANDLADIVTDDSIKGFFLGKHRPTWAPKRDKFNKKKHIIFYKNEI
jgi:predicted chitinase